MRFMMRIFPTGYEEAKPGTMPDREGVEAMMNQELTIDESEETHEEELGCSF